MPGYAHRTAQASLEEVDLKRCALLVIDELGDAETSPVAARILEPTLNTARICDAAREVGVPVIFANDAHIKGLDRELDLWGDHNLAGAPESQTSPQLKLREGDFVIGAALAQPGTKLLTITENGFGKRTPIEEYIRSGGEPQHRGGFGLKGYQITEKTGPAAGIKIVEEDDDILLISDDGTIIRMAAADVNVYSRTAQGVKVMRLAEESRVIALARTEKEEEETVTTQESEE